MLLWTFWHHQTCLLQKTPAYSAYSHFHSLKSKQFYWVFLNGLLLTLFLEKQHMALNSNGPPNSPALLFMSLYCKIIHSFLKWSLFVVYYFLRYCYIWLAFKFPLFSSHQPNNVAMCLLLLCPFNAIDFTCFLYDMIPNFKRRK